MDSSPGETLSKLVEEIIEWSRIPDLFLHKVKVSWSESHLKTVLNYVLTLGVDSNISAPMYTKFCLNQVWKRRFESQNYRKFAEMVVAFTQDDLQELFKVSQKDKTLEKNELVAVFISFLRQLLDQETYLALLDEEQVATLLKELRFLITILGDTPFQGHTRDELYQQTKNNLLSQFEQVANEAGSLVHSLIFATNDEVFNTMDEAVGVLLQQIQILKSNIIKFSNLWPNVMTPKDISHVESLFIVDSLICDLEDLMDREDDRIHVNVKDQIGTLHQELLISQSLLKDIEVPRNVGIQELKEPVMQITNVAHEAEYLIKSYLSGDSPLWYLTIRLANVIPNIELIRTGLKEMKKNYDIGALQDVAENFSAQLSSQDKRIPEVEEITVGFEDKINYMLEQLLGGLGGKRLQCISIFGMPGLDKTTLARKLYNHPSVNYHFDL